MEAVSRGSWIIATHKNADPDAIASAILLKYFIESIGGNACIMVPEGISSLTRRILSDLDVEYVECSKPYSVDGVIVVDASNQIQLGGVLEAIDGGSLILIDHHAPGNLVERAYISLVNQDYPSTTELVVEVIKASGGRVSAELATLGLIGILYDSRRFLIIGPRTFEITQTLIEWGGDYVHAVKILSQEREEDYSERNARLRALSRLKIARTCKDLLVAVTHIGSYESSVARSLIELGADIAVVLTERREGYRASVRTSRRAEARGVKADSIALYLAGKYGGEGGGHSMAAMAHLGFFTDTIEDAVNTISRSLPGKVARMCKGG